MKLRSAFPDAVHVVAGDFNQSLADRHYYGSRAQRAHLEAALAECVLVAMTAGGRDPIARDSAPYACIDHICISESPGLEAARTFRWPDAATPDRRLSDHFGVGVGRTRYENLQNAVARGHTYRVKRGLYASNLGVFRDRVPNVYLVAAKAAPDAAVSHHSALEAHGVAHTPLRTAYVTSTHRLRDFSVRGYRFKRVAPSGVSDPG